MKSGSSAPTAPLPAHPAEADLPESAGQILYTKFSFGLALLLLTVCLFGVLFNIVSMYIYTRPQMRAPINVLLTGLSAIDLLMLILAIFAFVIPGLNVVLMHPALTEITNYATIYLYPLAMMAQTCSIWTLVLITVERYIAICYPLRSLQWNTSYRMMVALIGVCFFAVAYNFVRFWEFKLGEPGSMQDVKMQLRSNPVYYLWYYTTLYLFTHFVVPFSLLIALNSLVAREIYLARKARQRLTRKQRGEHSQSVMMIVVIVVFAVCNALTIVVNIMEALEKDFFRNVDSWFAFILNDTSNLLVVLNSSTTWIIYYAFSEKYRTLFRRTLPCCCPGPHYDLVNRRLTTSEYLYSMAVCSPESNGSSSQKLRRGSQAALKERATRHGARATVVDSNGPSKGTNGVAHDVIPASAQCLLVATPDLRSVDTTTFSSPASSPASLPSRAALFVQSSSF
uniref:G-protein coupled receptors family 1 profile domain-containing protein n=1 Tax=Plectus sambesii TaxID=2011161 RepID=A0A914V7G5_9BILA